jgi:hypothetical protein
VVPVEEQVCVAEAQSEARDSDAGCLSGRDLSEYDYISVGKDGLVPVSVKPTSVMSTTTKELEWLRRRTEEYRVGKNDIGRAMEDMESEEKLGQGFSSVDGLDEVDIGDRTVCKPTYINTNLLEERKDQVCHLLKEFVDCFAWEYTKMPSLSRELVEHRLPIKPSFRPYKQPPRNFNPLLLNHITEEVDHLLKARFIQPCRYVDWVSNIVPIEKMNTDKIRVCVDFRSLNRATLKDEYPMPIVEALVNCALGNRLISFLNGNAGYNQIFMSRDDVSKTAFQCPGFVGLFE